MTKNDKIQWLIQHAPGPYARAKTEAMNELDEMTPVFCFCGVLAYLAITIDDSNTIMAILIGGIVAPIIIAILIGMFLDIIE
jgi:hypothetical protein